MKELLVLNIPTFILLIITGGMIYYDKPYWGWVLAAALVCTYGIKTSDKEK